jgi:hypothetical protein
VMKPAYSVSFLLSINILVWQNVLNFPNEPIRRILLVIFIFVLFDKLVVLQDIVKCAAGCNARVLCKE